MNAISSVSTSALSGLRAARTKLAVTANNIANASTGGFHRQEVAQTASPNGGVDVAVNRSTAPGADTIADALGQMAARQAFMANLAVFKSNQQMLGQLLDAKA